MKRADIVNLGFAAAMPLALAALAAGHTHLVESGMIFGLAAGPVWTAAVLQFCASLPAFVYFSIKVYELADANRQLGIIAATDGLTECLNRRAFIERVERRLAQTVVRPSGAMLVIDADHFKRINDRFGHQAGDRALALLADAIRRSVRAGDIVGRLGGEEFGVFLPGVSRFAAEAVAERLRGGVEAIAFAPEGCSYRLSVSIGGVVFDEPAQFESLFGQCDTRLYEAKQAGRNRVRLAGYVLPEGGFTARMA